MTTTREFYALVKRMRDAQKSYFRTRSREALTTSKALERRVDDEVAEYDHINDIG